MIGSSIPWRKKKLHKELRLVEIVLYCAVHTRKINLHGLCIHFQEEKRKLNELLAEQMRIQQEVGVTT